MGAIENGASKNGLALRYESCTGENCELDEAEDFFCGSEGAIRGCVEDEEGRRMTVDCSTTADRLVSSQLNLHLLLTKGN